MDRPTSEYAQSGSHHPPPQHPPASLGNHSDHHSEHPADQTSAAAAAAAAAAATHYPHTPQPEVRANPQYSHTPQPEARPANISSSNTPQPEYGLNPPPTRSPAYHQDYLPRPPQSYAPNSQPGGAPGMAQATSPFLPTSSSMPSSPMPPSSAPVSTSDPAAPPRSPDLDPALAHLPSSSNFTSDAAVPLDPSLPANSPTYPPPYSPYQPQGHDMAQYQGHPPPPHQMYARPDWPHSYGQQHHGLPGPYASPAATTVGSASPAATAGPRPGQVCF